MPDSHTSHAAPCLPIHFHLHTCHVLHIQTFNYLLLIFCILLPSFLPSHCMGPSSCHASMDSVLLRPCPYILYSHIGVMWGVGHAAAWPMAQPVSSAMAFLYPSASSPLSPLSQVQHVVWMTPTRRSLSTALSHATSSQPRTRVGCRFHTCRLAAVLHRYRMPFTLHPHIPVLPEWCPCPGGPFPTLPHPAPVPTFPHCPPREENISMRDASACLSMASGLTALQDICGSELDMCGADYLGGQVLASGRAA